jgi:flavin reductase (DIM6/NTAB) family NADH-FMN oxidoreductase RutF
MPLKLPDIATIFRRLDREVWLVTAAAGPDRGGLIATFVSQASIAPELPRVLIGLARSHHTWQLVDRSAAFALHLLGEANLEWVWRFGLQSGRDLDKLAGLECRTEASGSPILSGALAWLDCRVEARLETGDRTVFLGEVVAGEMTSAEPPLTVQRVLERASPEQLHELKRQMDRDAALDAEAIRAWRSDSPLPSREES